MKLIIIDRQSVGAALLRICRLYPQYRTTHRQSARKDEWLDNEAVCKPFGISKRTLQSYRDTGKIPFSMIGHKCYYKESDITELLNAKQ